MESSEGGGSRERTLLPNQAMGLVSAVLLLGAVFGLWAASSQLVAILRGPGVKVGVRVPYDVFGLALAKMPVPPGGRLDSGTGYGAAAVLETPELPLALGLFAGAGALVTQLALVAGMLYVRRVLLAIEGGEPFARRNAGRLARVAGLILLGGAVAPWLSWWGGREVLGHFGIDRDLILLPDLGFSALLLALVVLAGAEAFRRGRKLGEDSEGLV